jgi:GAF domain
MQQIAPSIEPTTTVSVLTRSLVNHRAEQVAEFPERQIKPACDVELSAGCEMVAKFLLTTTHASGVAIAILDDTGLHCRASAGEAPQPGTAIRVENSISGQCVRNAAAFHCDDALTKCPNALPARSILLLPILWGRHARGLVALFSRQPQTFGPAAIAIAGSAAAMVAIALNAWAPQLDVPIDGQVLEADSTEPVDTTPKQAAASPAGVAQKQTMAALPAFQGARKTRELCGLPCSTCGAYFAAIEQVCPVCQTPKV